jgi:rhodanese-related sulfurtransferase
MKKRSKKKGNIVIVIAIVLIALGIGYIINYYGNIKTTPLENVGYTDISVQAAKQLIDNTPELVIIDVSPKYDEGHLPNSVNYYVGDGSLDDALQVLNKNSIYLVYCHFDSASILGAEKMVKAGFKNVYRLEGNYAAWINAGYPIEY